MFSLCFVLLIYVLPSTENCITSLKIYTNAFNGRRMFCWKAVERIHWAIVSPLDSTPFSLNNIMIKCKKITKIIYSIFSDWPSCSSVTRTRPS
jgi:hypothetical protein